MAETSPTTTPPPAGFTPDWTLVHQSETGCKFSVGEYAIRSASLGWVCEMVDHQSGDIRSTGSLLGAAPDLYAACRAALNMIAPVEDPSDEVGHRVVGLLSAALAKAGGGA